MKRLWRRLIAQVALPVFLGAALAACTVSQDVRPGAGPNEYSISCWYLGWHICYEKAQQICPDRYKVLSETMGSGGRELRIACPNERREQR